MTDMVRDVRDFHRFFGHPIGDKPKMLDAERMEFRLDRIAEEFNELQDAVQDDDIAEVADALADLIYYTVGTAVELGIPLDEVWSAVHKANMSKAVKDRHALECSIFSSSNGQTKKCNCGAVLYTNIGKTAKPEGWKDPHEEIAKILLAAMIK